MSAVAKLRPETEAEPLTGLALLRVPFLPHQISKLPKPYKKDSPKGKCQECGGYHGLPAVHLDYVGHAALTDRLLSADPHWSWEPVADPQSAGLPVAAGGMWIRLTVCGVTRLGFGHPDGKSGGDAVKEVIGDALRNAAMRFGAALDLWHKGDLHADDTSAEPEISAEQMAINLLKGCASKELFKGAWEGNRQAWKQLLDSAAYSRVVAVKDACVATSQKQDAEAAAKAAAEAKTKTVVTEDDDFDPSDPFSDQIPF